jgi:Peptidase family M28
VRSLIRIILVAVGVIVVLLGGAAAFFRQPALAGLPYLGEARAAPERLRADVRFLTVDVRPRSAERTDNLDRAASYIATEFRKAGGRVRNQAFRARKREYHNVIADFGPDDSNRMLLVVGAHYDAFSSTGDLPGADDNASGTAGLLEIARLFRTHAPDGPVELVAFANEEPPFFGSEEMGSAVHAQSLAAGHRPVAGMICLEMIGLFHGQQVWPAWILSLIYPHRADFVAVSGGWPDRSLTRIVKRAVEGAGQIPVYSFTGPREMSDASDHRNYWSRGWPAVMVGDTAYLRNFNYHTIRDTPDKLDYVAMAHVVDGVYNGTLWITRRTRP